MAPSAVPCRCNHAEELSVKNSPVEAWDRVVVMDYGAFSLSGGDPRGSAMEELLEAALAGDGLAANEQAVVVCSPHQNNFSMRFVVERYEEVPDLEADEEWQLVFEATIRVGGGGLSYESPTIEPVVFPIPAGTVTLRVCGRGFVAEGWPGSTEPGDSWRVQCWASNTPVGQARWTRRWPAAEPVGERAEPLGEPVHRDSGVAAMRRIRSDLETGRSLSGVTGTARFDGPVRVPRELLWRHLHRPTAWLTDSGGGEEDDGFTLTTYELGENDLIVPRGWRIDCDDMEVIRSTLAMYTWRWVSLPRNRNAVLPMTGPTIVRITLDDVPDRAGKSVTTLVHLEHRDVPAEWVDDLASYWRWQMERADRDDPGFL
jgi:hypothetical protein